jgi:hypothetical protein
VFPGRGQLAHLPQRRRGLLLHLRLLELAEQLGALGDLLLQDHGVALHGLLGLARGLDRLVVQRLHVLDRLLGRHQLRGERLRGLLAPLRRGLVTRGARLVGHHERLPRGRLQLLDLAELAVQLHLQLPLVADDGGGLLRERLVLALRLLDGLLDLHLRVGVLVDLRRERRQEVLPGLHERVGHLPLPPVPALRALSEPDAGALFPPHRGTAAHRLPPKADDIGGDPDPRRGHPGVRPRRAPPVDRAGGPGRASESGPPRIVIGTAVDSGSSEPARRRSACRSPTGRRWPPTTSSGAAAAASASAASPSSSGSATSSASQIAASSSLEASLRPRSTSDR